MRYYTARRYALSNQDRLDSLSDQLEWERKVSQGTYYLDVSNSGDEIINVGTTIYVDRFGRINAAIVRHKVYIVSET